MSHEATNLLITHLLRFNCLDHLLCIRDVPCCWKRTPWSWSNSPFSLEGGILQLLSNFKLVVWANPRLNKNKNLELFWTLQAAAIIAVLYMLSTPTGWYSRGWIGTKCTTDRSYRSGKLRFPTSSVSPAQSYQKGHFSFACQVLGIRCAGKGDYNNYWCNTLIYFRDLTFRLRPRLRFGGFNRVIWVKCESHYVRRLLRHLKPS